MKETEQNSSKDLALIHDDLQSEIASALRQWDRLDLTIPSQREIAQKTTANYISKLAVLSTNTDFIPVQP